MSIKSKTLEVRKESSFSFSVLDFETIKENNVNRIKMAGFFDGKTYDEYIFDDPKEAPGIILDYLESKPPALCYAHYGGRFDFILLMNELKKRYTDKDYRLTMTISSSKIMRLIVSSLKTVKPKKLFELRDSSFLIKGSLADASQDFNTTIKKIKLNPKRIFKYKQETISKYLMHDCVSLYEVLDKFAASIGDTPSLSIGSCAVKYFNKLHGGNFRKSFNIKYHDQEEIRLGYTGGRTEVFKRFGTDLNYYDVRSMFPSAMYYNQFPCGDMYETHHIEKNHLGLYKIKWKCDTDIPIPVLWVRKDNTLLFPAGQSEGWYYSPEIELAEKQGYEIEVEKGYFWEDTCNPFKQYVETHYKAKEDSKGAKREVSKLLLNSLYGKFAQAERINRFTFNAPNEKQFDSGAWDFYNLGGITLWKNEIAIRAKHIVPQLSGFITSYARVKHYEYMKKCGSELYYVDTDCLVTTKKLVTGDKLGDLRLEYHADEGVFVLPKTYALKVGKESIIKAKGFELLKMKLTYEEMKQCLDNDYLQRRFRERYEKMVPFMSHFLKEGIEEFGQMVMVPKRIKEINEKRMVDGMDTRNVIV